MLRIFCRTGSHRRILFRASPPLVRIPVSPLLTIRFSDFPGFFRRLTYHRVSCCLYRNICPCRRRNEYIMNGRFSYKKYGDKPCQKWACLRSFFGVRLCVPACNINGIQEVSGSIPLISTTKHQSKDWCFFFVPALFFYVSEHFVAVSSLLFRYLRTPFSARIMNA